MPAKTATAMRSSGAHTRVDHLGEEKLAGALEQDQLAGPSFTCRAFCVSSSSSSPLLHPHPALLVELAAVLWQQECIFCTRSGCVC